MLALQKLEQCKIWEEEMQEESGAGKWIKWCMSSLTVGHQEWTECNTDCLPHEDLMLIYWQIVLVLSLSATIDFSPQKGSSGKRLRGCQRFSSWFHFITPTRAGYLWHSFVALLSIWAHIAYFLDHYTFLSFYSSTSSRLVSVYFTLVLHLLKGLLVTKQLK